MIRPEVRLATNDEGPAIAKILESFDAIPIGLDWSRVWPNWLVAVHRDQLVGCIQVLPGFPLAHVGCLTVIPEYQDEGIAAYLCWGAEQMLSSSGVSGLTFTSNDLRLIKGLERHGASDEGCIHLVYKPVPKYGEKKVDELTQSTETS
jgi:GNAT superfamily N-acetyltransferase